MENKPKTPYKKIIIESLILLFCMFINAAIWGVIFATIFFITTHLMAVDKIELREFNKNPDETLKLVGSIFGILFTGGIVTIYILIQQSNHIKKIL